MCRTKMPSLSEQQRVTTVAGVKFDQGNLYFTNRMSCSFVLANGEVLAEQVSGSDVVYGVFRSSKDWVAGDIVRFGDLEGRSMRLDDFEEAVLHRRRNKQLMFGCYDKDGKLRVSSTPVNYNGCLVW
jgi:hypothetical protein